MMNLFGKKQTHLVCIQFILDEQKINNNENTMIFDDITRIVEADIEQEAVGKFILQTKNITAKQKLDLRCYKLENLKKIK